MDIDAEQLGIPDQKYPVLIEMPASEFKKTCNDLSMFSDSLTIVANKGGITFKADGDMGGSKVDYNGGGGDADDEDGVGFLNNTLIRNYIF